MANGLPAVDNLSSAFAAGQLPNGAAGPPMPGGGPQDEVGQLLALREQIDQRLAELMGGPGGVPGGIPAGPPPMAGPPMGGPPPGLLAGAGAY